MIRDLSKKVKPFEEFDPVKLLSEIELDDLIVEVKNRGCIVFQQKEDIYDSLEIEAILDELEERHHDWTQQDLKRVLGLKPYATQEELVNEVKQLFLK